MEKLRQMARPDQFLLLKVAKSTLEFIRFEGELENRLLVRAVIARLEAKTIKLSGFPEQLKGDDARRADPGADSWEGDLILEGRCEMKI